LSRNLSDGQYKKLGHSTDNFLETIGDKFYSLFFAKLTFIKNLRCEKTSMFTVLKRTIAKFYETLLLVSIPAASTILNFVT
jgi:hypothetical protein